MSELDLDELQEISFNEDNFDLNESNNSNNDQSNKDLTNIKVTVIKKTGQTWTSTGEMLGDAENSIARFLRAGTSALPE